MRLRLVQRLAFVLVFLAAVTARARAGEWSFAPSITYYDPPGADAFLNPIVEADRGVLHLEARYNYEDLETGALFAGRTYEFGKDISWTVVPMLGIVLGNTDGFAPGLKLNADWRGFTFLTESEVVVDFEDAGSSFVYSWLEGSYGVMQGLRLGLAAQRTKTYETGLELQRGPLVEVSLDRKWLAFYWFNLDRPDDETFVVASGFEF